jgi:transcriptional regulator with XRE-family HTH domain
VPPLIDVSDVTVVSRTETATLIGGRMRAARDWRGWTGSELAARAGYANGCNVYAQYEQGRHEPTLATSHRLADTLDVSLAWLIGGDGDPPWD